LFRAALSGRFSERAKLARNPFSTIKLPHERGGEMGRQGDEKQKNSYRSQGMRFPAPEAILGAAQVIRDASVISGHVGRAVWMKEQDLKWQTYSR
jgi:hypothetical protein